MYCLVGTSQSRSAAPWIRFADTQSQTNKNSDLKTLISELDEFIDNPFPSSNHPLGGFNFKRVSILSEKFLDVVSADRSGY